MNKNNEIGSAEIFCCIALIFCFGVVVWLMDTFDIGFQIAVETAPKLILWIIAVGCVIYYGVKMENSLVIWGAPLGIAFLVPVFSPILKAAAGVREMDGFVFDGMVAWYGTGWGMFLIFFGIIIVGYGLLYWWHRKSTCY
ncbi:hypothetical protein TH60_21595 [Pantoea ananatis]|jgi:hypothetical protein|uniref:hypothetical protein n=1 Tax=Pantoea ananas TaxID=553 RepID=UPI000CF37ADB|nr:hypothetical protein [Pantoea ananatis]MDC7872088.1 hypothetical protein [Pantoea ananatis]PQK69957.1 hypothetical protein CG427_20550 [Pantoea ananatis]PQK82986.1 hypothetical protein CG431_20505 [Pantoea ananatis]